MATKTGGAGADVLRGTDKADWIYGNGGDDRLDGLGGNDALFGGAGRDTLNGGSGSDYVDGGAGDDLLIYSMTENRNAYDVYNGWTGNDTLRLVLTAAEWSRADVKADVARFLAYLPEYNEPLGWIDDPVLSFKSVGLSVVGVNKLEVVVDGKVVNPADAPVVAADDVLAVGEDDAGATVDVLANDLAADGVKSVTIAQPANGKVELVSTNFTAEKPSAVIKFTPGDAYQSLAEGQTATEVFTYTVTDKDGDTKTAAVTVTITGSNDGPVAVADTAAVTADGSVLQGSVATNDRDVDGDELTYYADYQTRPEGFDMNSDGSWTFDPLATSFWDQDQARTVKRLAAGETLTFEIGYNVYDPSYSSTKSTLTITVTGVNDAAILQNTQDLAYEEYQSDWMIEDGVHSTTGSLNILDWDAEYGDATVTVVGAGDGNIGTLTLTGFDEEEGRYGYRFDVDSAALAALAEGEEKSETFQLLIDDGQGSVTTQSFEILIFGDGNDPVEVPDWPLFGGDVVDADGVRTVTYQISFDDEDDDDVHTATVAWADPDALGDISARIVTNEDDGRHLEVTYTIPLDQLDTISAGYLEQTFQVTLTDNAGSTVDFERTVEVHNAQWQIGDAANDFIEGFDTGTTRDVLIGGEGADKIVGGEGRDWLYGDAGPDLPADQENAYWFPEEWTPVGGFNDELDGGAGADLLTGGDGADRFVFRQGETDGDVITDFNSADGDKVVLFGRGEGSTVARLDATRWQVTSGDGLSTEVITLANGVDLTEADIAFEDRAVEWRIGGGGDDSLSTPSGEVRHVLVGGGGRDSLVGDEFADELYGDEGPALPAGKENLFDGSSNWPWGDFDDELNGYGGADLLVGGAGADLFIFGESQANGDVVRDFNAAEGDRLDFSDWGWGATFTQLDETRWEIADEYRYIVEVITFENAPNMTSEDYFFG